MRTNPAKKWWFDLEIVDGVCVEPKGTNQRDIDPARQARMDPAKQRIAYYFADAMPPPDAGAPFPVNRKTALAAAAKLETPEEAMRRKSANGTTPSHYGAPSSPVGEPTPRGPSGSSGGGKLEGLGAKPLNDG